MKHNRINLFPSFHSCNCLIMQEPKLVLPLPQLIHVFFLLMLQMKLQDDVAAQMTEIQRLKGKTSACVGQQRALWQFL